MRLNVEEMYFLAMFDTTSRQTAIRDISASMNSFIEPDMQELVSQVLRKLKKMTDADFAALDFSVCREDDENE